MIARPLVFPRATGRGSAEIVVALGKDCQVFSLSTDEAVRFATQLLVVAREEAALASAVSVLAEAEG